MNIWQISPFLSGYDDDEQRWSENVKNNVITIGWEKLGDLTKYKNKEELRKSLKTNYDYSKTDRTKDVESCWKFSREIKKKDIIVAKKGSSKGVYGIGVVTSEYEFFQKHIGDFLNKHVVKVTWILHFDNPKFLSLSKNFVQWTVNKLDENTYKEIKESLVNEQPALKPMFVSIENHDLMQSDQNETSKNEQDLDEEGKEEVEHIEGQRYEMKILRSSRNRKVVDEKKRNSNYTCEICKINFERKYGKVGKNYIVAHHKDPLAMGERATKLEDLVLVCDNCHRMLHKGPPYKPEELTEMLKTSN